MTEPRGPWLSVVIPAYNEVRRLPQTLQRVLAYLRTLGKPFEVVVADDGSSDGTEAVARSAGPEVRVVRIEHAGKGAATRSGVLATSGDFVLITDADLSTPIEEMEHLYHALEADAGLAVGSRRLQSSRIQLGQPLHRRIMARVFSLLVKVLVLGGVHDTQCGFKLFRGPLAREVFSVAVVNGFAFDVEAILLARRLGARIVEVPVEWHDAAHSRVRALRDSAAMIRELFAIRRRARLVRRLPHGLTVVEPLEAAPAVSRRGLFGELAMVFWLALSAYLAAGAFLVLHEHLLEIDAYSRVAIAHRILFSRDPHLLAIGFVWSPLPILALLPLVPLASVWPALTTYGFAASIVSAICMAAAAREVAAFLRDMGVGRIVRRLLTLAFAAHPLVVLYAANGMSEAMFLLFLLMAARRLAGWRRTENLSFGTGAAIALAAAYLSRYEALAAAAAAMVLAAAWAYRRKQGTVRRRLEQAVCDATMVGAPVLVAFGVFALASWAITGNLMEQFTSTYGNSAQLRVLSASSAVAGPWEYAAVALNQVLVLEPFLLVIVAFTMFRTWRRGRRATTLAVLAVVGAVLAFMLWSGARGMVDRQLRYMITAIPLLVLAAGSAVATLRKVDSPLRSVEADLGGTSNPAEGRDKREDRRSPPADAVPADRSRSLRPSAAMAAGMATLLMLASALPVSAYGMTSPELNHGEWALVRATYGWHGEMERRAPLRFATERRIAADLDAMNLPPGSVLVDVFLGFAVPLNSRNPRQFVITSDRDFQSVLSDPAAGGVTYVLVPEPTDLAVLDAINRRYPSLYAHGAGMATLVKQYTNPADVAPAHWRLYRLRPETGP